MTASRALLARLARFGTVGVAATLLYAALAGAFDVAGLSATPASFAAYLIAAVFSFLGHRGWTFRSSGVLARELPRFAAVNAAGLALALAAPLVLTEALDLPGWVAVAVVCLGVPALSFLGLNRWVFRGQLG